jgi:hypothetical protein
VHPGSNNQAPPASLDDLFLSIGVGSEDLHLESSGNNALDNGTSLAGSFTDDIDSETRPYGSGWDIGADEYVAPSINYRSIGINAATLYDVGDATIGSGTTTVTFGSGASLPANVGVGDRLVIGAETFFSLSRDSATQVTVQTAAATGHSGDAYAITRAYNTFQSWEDDRDGDLVGENRTEVGVAYDDGDFVAASNPLLGIDGSITDATRYLWVTVGPGQRHNGTAGTGVVLDGVYSTQFGFDLKDDYTRVDGLEFKRFSTASGGPAAVRVSDAFNVLLDGLIVHDFPTAGGAVYGIRGSPSGTASFTVATASSTTVTSGIFVNNRLSPPPSKRHRLRHGVSRGVPAERHDDGDQHHLHGQRGAGTPTSVTRSPDDPVLQPVRGHQRLRHRLVDQSGRSRSVRLAGRRLRGLPPESRRYRHRRRNQPGGLIHQRLRRRHSPAAIGLGHGGG